MDFAAVLDRSLSVSSGTIWARLLNTFLYISLLGAITTSRRDAQCSNVAVVPFAMLNITQDTW